MPSLHSVRLETARLVLRELAETDVAAHRALDADPDVVRYQSNDVTDETGTREYLRGSIAAAGAQPRGVFDLAVCLRDRPDQLLGRVGIAVRRPEHREAELWFVLGRECWGRGYGREG